MVLAAADDVTRQRCVRIIEAASELGGASSLHDIASSVALTRSLIDMKSLDAVKAVQAALGVAMDHPLLHFYLPSLLVEFGYDAVAAAGFDVSCILVSFLLRSCAHS